VKRGLNTKKNKGFLSTIGTLGVVTLTTLALSVFTMNKDFSPPAAVIQLIPEEETVVVEEEIDEEPVREEIPEEIEEEVIKYQ
jgi:hypothetical protein